MEIKKLTRKRIFLGAILVISVASLMWFFLKTPSNTRDWALNQAVLPYAVITEESVTVFNIRNFTYNSTSDYIPAYYDKTYVLHELVSIDYIVEPLGNLGVAHTFLSFGFTNGEYLAISVEARKERGEPFSPLKGLFRGYELIYVVADERDAVKLRTNYRKNDAYLYPVQMRTEYMRTLFVSMLTRANALHANPEFYNTFTNTCTTNIVRHINAAWSRTIPWDIRLLLPKNSDELAYELGLIDTSVSLGELRKRHKINDLAERYADDPDFSIFIRQGY